MQTTQAMTSDGNADTKHKRRIIALHGKGDDGLAFERSLQPLVEATAKEGWEWVWPTAPHQVCKTPCDHPLICDSMPLSPNPFPPPLLPSG